MPHFFAGMPYLMTLKFLGRQLTTIIIVASSLGLAGCGFLSSSSGGRYAQSQDSAPTAYVNINDIPNAKPRYLPKSKYGNPESYVVRGKRYHVLTITN